MITIKQQPIPSDLNIIYCLKTIFVLKNWLIFVLSTEVIWIKNPIQGHQLKFLIQELWGKVE